ncbi:MAG TPA: hypothetical protein DCE41_10985 [Cytophagales bacterium]|nr:hypothetical protein [Cytophagales bacterium]HAA18738.1 hypothetical protein [Cytophagales bacterium]HAP58769.1 hypothetical protein [Cytophagales bacterium]
MTHTKDSANQPPFLLSIGAAKAGTTWLWDNLKEHPDIWTLPYKSTQYFSGKAHQVRKKKWNRHRKEIIGKLRPHNLMWHWNHFKSKPVDDRWFLKQFQPAKPGQVRVDISTSYAGLPLETLQHINSLIPNTKVVYLLRNPIDRQWSNAKLSLIRNGGRSPEDISFEEYLEQFEGEGMQRSTNYLENYQRWASVVGKENVFVGFYDQVGQDPYGLLQSVCEFAGIPYQKEYFAKTAERNIFKGAAVEMPEEVSEYLHRTYGAFVNDIKEQFGSYANQWATQNPATPS